MNIQKIAIEKIEVAAYNPRISLRPGQPEYEKLKRSIQDFGLVEPLVWNSKNGRLVGGHQRLSVLKEMGATEVEVVVVDLDEKKEKALNIALNKIQGNWDMPLLKEVLVDLDDGEFPVELTGFSHVDIKELVDWEKETFGTEDPEDQSRLDTKRPVKCPSCGNEFTP